MNPPSLLLVYCCFGRFVCSHMFLCPALLLQADFLCHLPNFICLKSTYSVYVFGFITENSLGLCLLFSYHDSRVDVIWSTDRPQQHQIHQMLHPENKPDLPLPDMPLQRAELARGGMRVQQPLCILHIDHWWHTEKRVCQNIFLVLKWSAGLSLLF